MLEWQKDGRAQWFEASGVGERRGGMVRSSGGRISSSYGRRRHPILGYTRMHTGVDFAGGYGAPIHAATDGTEIRGAACREKVVKSEVIHVGDRHIKKKQT